MVERGDGTQGFGPFLQIQEEGQGKEGKERKEREEGKKEEMIIIIMLGNTAH